MPNGGSDCCGTCWFNLANGGKAGSLNHDKNVPSYCEIRDLAIERPFYTYCANHPHHRPDRDPIPIGPVTRARSTGNLSYERDVWQTSPDTEEIRQHLLGLLDTLFKEAANDRYPFFAPMADAILWQIGQFHETRATHHLQWLIANSLERLAKPAYEALEEIQRQSS